MLPSLLHGSGQAMLLRPGFEATNGRCWEAKVNPGPGDILCHPGQHKGCRGGGLLYWPLLCHGRGPFRVPWATNHISIDFRGGQAVWLCSGFKAGLY